MSIKFTPTFVLRGIDPYDVIEKYKRGAFSNIKSKPAIAIRSVDHIDQQYSKDPKDPIYRTTDHSNHPIILAKTNSQNYEILHKQGSPKQGGRCDYCKTDFTNEAIGYPVEMKEIPILDQNRHYKIYRIFTTDGEFCCFECAAGMLRHYRISELYENNLHYMYACMHPNEPLLYPAPDPKLLIDNGGCLPRDQWLSKSHHYIHSNTLILTPVINEYEKRHNIVN